MVYEYCEIMPLPPSGWLFWLLDTDKAISTDLLLDLFAKAESEAGLEPSPYMKWHSLRRKWGSDRNGLPLSEVMIAGGWKHAKSFLDCYQLPPREAILRVLEHPLKCESGDVPRPAATETRRERMILLR